jgi:hypothetical protein
MRPLPDHWDADEIRFFDNWTREMASLHDTLMSTAADRVELLHTAKKTYFNLACRLKEQLRKMPAQTRGDAVVVVRR